MKRSEELRIEKTQKIERMQAIVAAAEKEKKRSLTDDEQAEWDRLDGEVRSLTTEIQRAERMEELGQFVSKKDKSQRQDLSADDDDADDTQHHRDGKVQIMKRAGNTYNVSRAIRRFADGHLDGLEGEAQSELQRQLGIKTKGLLIPTVPIYRNEDQNIFKRANENTTTTHADVLDVFVQPDVSIIGHEPLYRQMGLTILEGLHGSLKLSKKSPSTGQKVAQEAQLANNSDNPSTNDTLSPNRYGDKDVWTAELLAQENPAIHAKLLADLVKGCDRKITADVYTHLLAAATETTGGALTEAGLNTLMEAVEGDGAFAMDRGSFFQGKAVKFDTGSGLRLLNRVAGNASGVAETWEGVKAFYSELFADGANQQYVIYGLMSEMYVGMWGALEMLMDPYTLADYGETRVIVNRLADMASRNDAAFVKSPDLDATT